MSDCFRSVSKRRFRSWAVNKTFTTSVSTLITSSSSDFGVGVGVAALAAGTAGAFWAPTTSKPKSANAANASMTNPKYTLLLKDIKKTPDLFQVIPYLAIAFLCSDLVIVRLVFIRKPNFDFSLAAIVILVCGF